jgi:hypothetical protein
MSETEGPREDAPNQEAIDEEGANDEPVGGWEETEPTPHAGEAGQSDDVA